MKPILFSLYDESALGVILRYTEVIDCSGLLANMSRTPRKIAENVIDVLSRRKKLRNPGYRSVAFGFLHRLEGDSDKFKKMVDKYYPKYWEWLKRSTNKHRKEMANGQPKGSS